MTSIGFKHFNKQLEKSVHEWESRLKSSAKAKAPSHLIRHIDSEINRTERGDYEVLVWVNQVDNTDDGQFNSLVSKSSVDSFAQEYGHPGAKIIPKHGKYLAFHWQKVPNFKPRRLPDGRVLLGRNYKTGAVQALVKTPQPAYNSGKGFLRPAVEEWKLTLPNEKLPIGRAILNDVKDFFGNLFGKKR